jgi:hypothetical protein
MLPVTRSTEAGNRGGSIVGLVGKTGLVGDDHCMDSITDAESRQDADDVLLTVCSLR